MKKLFTLAIAAGMAASMSMDAESLFRMTEFGNYDNLEIYQFEWNDDNQIVRKNVENDDETYILYVYNEDGKLTLQEGYQYFYDEADPKKDPVALCTYRVKYFYDEKGNLVEERVQNQNINTNEILSDACLVNVYNSDGKIATQNQYFIRGTEHPERFADCKDVNNFQNVNYTYNDLGQLVEEEYITYALDSEQVTQTSTYTYIYDGKGRNVVIKSISNNVAGATRVYVYDEEGSCAEYFETNSQFRFEINENGDMEVMNRGNVSRRLIFTCSDVPRDRCFYPNKTYDEEYGRFFDYMTYQLESIDEYRRADDDVLHEWGTWDVEWLEVEPNGIEGISADAAQVDFSINGNVMTINGLDRNATVNIFDMNGRLVQASKGGMVFLGHLNEGVYVVATPAGNAKIVR